MGGNNVKHRTICCQHAVQVAALAVEAVQQGMQLYGPLLEQMLLQLCIYSAYYSAYDCALWAAHIQLA